jgi:hypothetical protein
MHEWHLHTGPFSGRTCRRSSQGYAGSKNSPLRDGTQIPRGYPALVQMACTTALRRKPIRDLDRGQPGLFEGKTENHFIRSYDDGKKFRTIYGGCIHSKSFVRSWQILLKEGLEHWSDGPELALAFQWYDSLFWSPICCCAF